MAFVVEDGSGLDNATSYIDEAFADDYFSDRGNTDWATLSSTVKQQVLIKATDYIDKRFGIQFSGYPNYKTQRLQWPRYGACKQNGWWINSNGELSIPNELKWATAEYALQAALAGSLIEEGSTEATASPKIGETIKVGPVTVSERFSDSSSKARVSGVDVISDSSIPEYPAADLIIAHLLEPSGESDLFRG